MHPIISFLLLTVAPPHISQVVVYPDRAQITREQKVACGEHVTVLFEGVPPSADPSSFRARASVGTVMGLRSEERTRKEAFMRDVEDIDEQLHKLNLEQVELEDAVARDEAQKRIASRYNAATATLVSREMLDGAANAKNWGQALELSLAAQQKAVSDEVDRNARLREIARKREELQQKRGRLRQAAARTEYLAEVLLGCAAGQENKESIVELNYFVGGAQWTAGYEARADEGRGEVELSTYATVTQSTGENWQGVQVVLSTAVPRENATPPDISPLRLWVEERKAEKKVLVGRQEITEHAEGGLASLPQGQAASPMVAAEQGLSVQLAAPDAADVAGDGTPSRVLVARTKLKAQFASRTVPKLMPFVFRVADLSNTAAFPLLAGTVDAFRKPGNDGGYMMIGRYPLERVAQGTPFHLTFGVDESEKVKRQVVQETVRDKNLLGSVRRFRYAYHFDVESHPGRGDRDQSVQLSEPIPVSELDDVKVTVDPKSTPGYELLSSDGILSWKLSLKAGEKKSLDLIYNVDVPASYDSGGAP